METYSKIDWTNKNDRYKHSAISKVHGKYKILYDDYWILEQNKKNQRHKWYNRINKKENKNKYLQQQSSTLMS